MRRINCRATPLPIASGSAKRSSSSSTPRSVGRVRAKPTTVPSADVATRVRPQASTAWGRVSASGGARRGSRSPALDREAARKMRARAGSSPATASRTENVLIRSVFAHHAGVPAAVLTMTLRLHDQETEALRRRAGLEGRSMQEVARQAVRDYIERTSKRELLDRALDEELPRYAEAPADPVE